MISAVPVPIIKRGSAMRHRRFTIMTQEYWKAAALRKMKNSPSSLSIDRWQSRFWSRESERKSVGIVSGAGFVTDRYKFPFYTNL